MRVLIACESSGTVRRAFAARGHYAVSCDLLPADDGETVMHRTGDVGGLLALHSWDLLIAHPPCTYLSVSGKHWDKSRNRALPLRKSETEADRRYKFYEGRDVDGAHERAAIEFFMMFANADVPRICIENPVGVMSTRWRKPDCEINPWEHGDPESKTTHLWLKGLAPLVPTNVLPLPPSGRWANQTPSGQNKLGPSADRWKERSKTYQGIADAMAAQWG